MTPETLRVAWKQGRLLYKYHPLQFLFQQAWKKAQANHRKFMLRGTRRGRKSSWFLLSDFEDCIKTNGFQAAFVAPVEVGLEEYIQQIAERLTADAPKDLKPVWKSSDCQFRFPQQPDSVIYCAGSNSKSYNRLRGYRFDRADVDEGSYIDDLQEVVEGVLLPALFDSKGYLRIGGSAPELPDHQFDKYWGDALLGGYGFQVTIDQSGYDPALIEEWAKEYGGRQSARFRREFLCETVIDHERLLIPEWRSADYVREMARDEFFQFYHKYHSLDTGVRDFTVDLMAYYDFKRAAIVIEDEILLKGEEVRTDRLALAIKKKEKDLNYAKVYRRIGDNNNLIILQDLQGIHGLPFYPTTKDELFAMVNEVRLWVNSGRVLVNPHCKYLIGCLENGIWDKNKKEFARSVAYGHFDGIAALCYLIRHIDTNTNPVPKDYNMSVQTHHIPVDLKESENYKALRQALNLPLPQRTTDRWKVGWR